MKKMTEITQPIDEKPETPRIDESEKTPKPNKEPEKPLEDVPVKNSSNGNLSWRERIEECLSTKLATGFILPFMATILGGLVLYMIPKIEKHFNNDTCTYITFNTHDTNIRQKFKIDKIIPNLYYSVGDNDWQELGIEEIDFGGDIGALRLRGKSPTGTAGAKIYFLHDGKVTCSGDIRTLVDYKHYEQADTKDAVFTMLFENCKDLIDAPRLPSEQLAENCYMEMFAGCTSLKNAPDLPATKLSTMCYRDMFKGCTSLEQAPILPATKLADWCYTGMFSRCTSLKTGSNLTATKLSNNCYVGMFSGCTSLSTITMMTVDILNNSCFYRWLDDTSPTGTFFKNMNAQWSNDGVVPEGWDVVPKDPKE